MKSLYSLAAVLVLSMTNLTAVFAQDTYIESRFTIDEQVRQKGGYAAVKMTTVQPNKTNYHKIEFTNDFDYVEGNGCVREVLVDVYLGGEMAGSYAFSYDPAVCTNRLYEIQLDNIVDNSFDE